MTDHDPVGNEQRAVDGDLDGGIYGPCLGPTTSASRWRQGESPVSADGRAEPVRLGIAPWVDTPCLTLDRSDSVRTVGPGTRAARVRALGLTRRYPRRLKPSANQAVKAILLGSAHHGYNTFAAWI